MFVRSSMVDAVLFVGESPVFLLLHGDVAFAGILFVNWGLYLTQYALP